MDELRVEDVRSFRNFLRMEPAMFQEVVDRLIPRITKVDTFCRKALAPGLKLAITLKYLASGDNYHSLMYGFRVPHNSISIIIRDVCEAIIAEFADEVIECPTTEDQWRRIAEQFSRRWQFHHCLGALDGKHIAITCPSNAGSEYYNYKGFHSIIFMALVDGDYKFSWVDVGSNGSAGDAQVFNRSELKECIEGDSVGVPGAEPLVTTLLSEGPLVRRPISQKARLSEGPLVRKLVFLLYDGYWAEWTGGGKFHTVHFHRHFPFSE